MTIASDAHGEKPGGHDDERLGTPGSEPWLVEEERLKRDFQRENRAFRWTCIWFGAAVLLWCAMICVDPLEEFQRRKLAVIPGDARFGAELQLSRTAISWKLGLGAAAFPLTLCFAGSMAYWLWTMRARRRVQ